MEIETNNNGYEYVDLGLPNGTLWATCNVGASKPSDFGLYFQWGDTKGYTEDQVGTGKEQKKFFWTDYKFNPSGDGSKFTKYLATNEWLFLEDDAAHVNMGGDWHMPNPAQIKELIDNTNYVLTTLNDGVKGMKFTSKKNSSKYIFIPAAGYAWNGSLDDIGNYGYIWSSMSDAYFDDYGKALYFISKGKALSFISKGAYIDGFDRDYGLAVRGVIG